MTLPSIIAKAPPLSGVELLGDAHTQRLKRHGLGLSGWRVTVLLNGREGMRKNGEWPNDVWLGLRTPEESHVSTAACTHARIGVARRRLLLRA